MNTKMRTLFLLVAMLSTASAELLNKPLVKRNVMVGGATLSVEVADTPQSMQQGLMFRDSLPRNAGMLFVYPQPQQLAFWMKNTLISLDLLFFDASGTVREIKRSLPPCLQQKCPIYYSSDVDIKSVIEINAGSAARLNIRVGDQLQQ